MAARQEEELRLKRMVEARQVGACRAAAPGTARGPGRLRAWCSCTPEGLMCMRAGEAECMAQLRLVLACLTTS